MYTIARELPFAAVLSPQFQDLYCATCFEEIDTKSQQVLTCDDCSEVSYCSLRCQRKDWKSVHQFECEILRSQNSDTPMTVTMRLCIRILLNTFKNNEQYPSFNGAIIEDLETNYKEFRSSSSHNQFLTDVLTIIKSSGHNIFPKSVENNRMIAIICSVLCNSFGIIDEKRVEPIGSGMYIGLAKHNHSCASTSHVVFEKSQVLLRSKEKEYCRNTTISYVSRMLPTAERQKSIRGVHFITCRCEMCQNEDLDLIGLASRCQTEKCQGYVKGSTNCGVCGKSAIISFDQSTQSTSQLIDTLENLHKTNQGSSEFSFLQNLRSEYIRILADCNVAILQLDEQIAYCASDSKSIPNDLEEIAIRGYDQFISRLGIGSPEVTRRLYIACKCLSRLSSLSPSAIDILKLALQSSIISHGEDHFITKYVYDLSNDSLEY